ncbi:MAG: branched-chain amino acid ABC transporter permease [Acetobacteraceae bacterium]|nr:branched-chain amino acid ABC transporter permease [Acetobacteraceae bacterium]MBV8590841.1 branched-chain amino acid ABC transporter permease [Acetobacteraceae bacterium]
MLVKLWQALISGLSVGSIYALIAQGYYITYITTGALNFGQGEFLMIGALFGLTCYVVLGLPYALAILGAVLVTGLMGIVLERIAIRPVMRHALSLSWVLSTVAVSIILKNAAVDLWGPEQIKFPSAFGEGVVQIGPAGIFPQELFIIAVALGTVFAIQIFLRRSLLGKALMAVAFNRNAAAVMGINVPRMVVLAFVLSSALAGLGGILIAPITFAWAYMGTVPGIKAFAAAIFGGLENPIGILIGGLIIGVLEQLFGIINSNLKEGITFLFILLALAIRPTGLMGRQEIVKV